MIFQINYNDAIKYEEFYQTNNRLYSKINYKLYGRNDIEEFLDKHPDYNQKFQQLSFDEELKDTSKPAVYCDFLRICILYEYGGIYLDSDIILKDDIIILPQYVKKFKTLLVIPKTRSLYFMSSHPKGRGITFLRDKYMSTEKIHNDRHMVVERESLRSNVYLLEDATLDRFFVHDYITSEVTK